jgi:Sulfotransferase domain
VAPAQDSVGPPDFIGVGTQRSGTTWWFETLLEHPQIRGPRNGHKEQHFFDRFCRHELRPGDLQRYFRRFPRAPGQIAGEWTPRYMFDFWTPRVIARVAPEAKLLIMLRDPIERFRSGVPHRLSRAADPLAESAAQDAIERGRYATQLRRLLACHEREKLLILQYERCRADPGGEYRRTLAFLGVDPGHRPAAFDALRGTTQAATAQPLWDHLAAGLNATYEPEVAALAELVPELDLSLWPNFAHLTRDAVAR